MWLKRAAISCEIGSGFALADTYHNLPLADKLDHEMDVVTDNGSGYLPLSNLKLPKPEKPNLVEAYVIKREHGPRGVHSQAICPSACDL